MPLPKYWFHTRLTNTRAVSGFLSLAIQFASAVRRPEEVVLAVTTGFSSVTLAGKVGGTSRCPSSVAADRYFEPDSGLRLSNFFSSASSFWYSAHLAASSAV